jgi:phage FluMu gp28-like protein
MNFSEYYDWLRAEYYRDFQNELIDATFDNEFVAVLGARQIGKTAYLAIMATLLAGGVKNPKDGSLIPASDVFVISATFEKGINVIKEVNSVLSRFNLIETITHDQLGGKTQAVLKNGKTITAVAGKPGCLQGFTGHVFWDEASLTEHDPADIYTQCMAASSAKSYYRVVLCSNADKFGSWTNNFFKSQQEDWKRMRSHFSIFDVDIYKAYPKGIPKHILKRKDSMTVAAWNRFYLNMFQSGEEGRFKSQLVESTRHNSVRCLNGIRCLSIDPGFSINGNPAGVVVASVDNAQVEVNEAHHWYGKTESEQRELIDALIQKHQVSRIYIDQGVGGMVMRDNLIKAYGSHAVVPLSVTRNKYNLWALEVEKLLTSNNLKINAGCEILIDDLLSFEVDGKGNLKVPERPAPNGKSRIHADAGVALLMLTEAVGGTIGSFEVETIEVNDSYSAGDDLVFGWDENDYNSFI